MVATIAVELALAIWVLVRFAHTRSRWLIALILVNLAGFQWAEFNVCTTSPISLMWSRLGYIFITLLPPLGLHLIVRLAHWPRRVLIWSYLVAAAFIGVFTFAPSTLNLGVCTGNYVIFQLAEPYSKLYGLYYFGLLFAGITVSRRPLSGTTTKQRRALDRMAIGYLSFIVPTLIIIYWLPGTGHGIPSIMCGFAVIFALILGLGVAKYTDR